MTGWKTGWRSSKTPCWRLPGFGITGAGTELTLRYVEEADWANAWKAYFKPFRVGRRLVVTPPWEHPDLTPDDIPLVIDPGMAFGTGSHPTTQLCLTALEDFVQPGQAVADVGTGSGILAIAAAKLGASPVAANDNDPLAVKIARENAAANGVSVTVTEALPDGRLRRRRRQYPGRCHYRHGDGTDGTARDRRRS